MKMGGDFLKEWIDEWYSLYQAVWELPLDNQVEVLENKTQELLMTWGSLDEALQQLKKKLKAENGPYAYQSQGTYLFDQGEFDQACLQLKQEQGEEKQEAVRCLYLGYALLYTNDFIGSEEYFRYVQFISTQPLILHLVYQGLGLVAMLQNKLELAIQYLEKAQPLAENHEVMYNLGVCYFTLENYTYAITCFRRYAYVKDDSDGLYALGLALLQTGEIEEARAAFLEVIESVEQEADLLAVAQLVEWIGEHELACYAYEHLMLLTGKTPRWLHGFAWNKALAGDKRAIHLLEELGQTDPEAKKSFEWIQATVK